MDQGQRWWWCTVLARSRPCGAFVPRPYPGQTLPPRREPRNSLWIEGPKRHRQAPTRSFPKRTHTTLYSQVGTIVAQVPTKSLYIASADQGPGENMKCAHLWVFYNKTIWGNRPNASEALSSIQATSSSNSSTISKKSSIRAKANIFCFKRKHNNNNNNKTSKSNAWGFHVSGYWNINKHRADHQLKRQRIF